MSIDYQKYGFNTTTFINPTNMNWLDDGIKAACDGVDKLDDKVGSADISKIGDGSVTGAVAQNAKDIEAVNSNLSGLNFSVLTAQMPTSRSAFYLGAFASSPEKGYIVSAMCSTDKTTWVNADRISDIAFTVNTANNGQAQVRGDIGNDSYYCKWCKVIVASVD